MNDKNKNLLVQILWIIAAGIILWFLFFRQNVNQSESIPQTKTTEQLCMERAIEKSNEMEKFLTETDNPYLQTTDEQIQKTKEGIKNKEYQECLDIWVNPIEEK